MLSEEATNTNFIVFGLTRSGLEPMTYRIRGEQARFLTLDVTALPNVCDSEGMLWCVVHQMICLLHSNLHLQNYKR